MNKLYHRVPDEMKGGTLYPLNELKDVYTDVYTREKEKYEGREFVMQQRIPYLDCLWNDVLHLTSVHPKKIKEALGVEKTFKSYIIDPHSLEPKNTIVYLYEHEERSEKMSRDNFTDFDPDKVDKYATLPKATQEYYREMMREGKRPLLFVRVSHILYQGSIDASGLDIVEV